ncbi:FAD-binding domain-containing protein [Apiospora arundinis]
MRADEKYAQELRDWRIHLDEWNAAEKKKESQRRLGLLTPGQQANENLNRFMAIYFLDEQGRPDRTKQHVPIALHGFTNRSELHERAKRIPGLETMSGGEGSSRTLCVGWDRNAVWTMAHRLDEESHKKPAKNRADKWDQAMEEHKRFAQLVKKEGPKFTHMSPQPVKLQKCGGSYLIRCEAAEQWSSPHFFTLDIATGARPFDNDPRMTLGWLQLAHFQGTMILCLDRHRLDTYLHPNTGGDRNDYEHSNFEDSEDVESPVDSEISEVSEGSEDSDDSDCVYLGRSMVSEASRNVYSDGDTDQNSEDDSDDGYDSDSVRDSDDNTDNGNSEEGYESDSSENSDDGDNEEVTHDASPRGNKRKARVAGSPRDRPLKKARRAPVPARRVHLRLRGREMDGPILHEPEDGYIDFTDETFTHFCGIMSLHYIGDKVSFEGFKISHYAKKRAEPWESFSKAEYDREEVARWH